MSGVPGVATARARRALPLVVGAVVALLLPSLLMTTSDAAGTATIGVLALALAALLQLAQRCEASAARPGTTVCPTGAETAPVLAGRVTDPVHHPLRPRAPGLR